MKKITFTFVFLLLSSAFAYAGDGIKPASEDVINCMQPYYGPERFKYINGRRIPLDLWFEQHPDDAARYYRNQSETRKRYEKNKEAGICS
ncbi:MAG: hypothetical protein ACAH17_02060 [Candidatus Paceibacterota bacterium]|jgi:hypothetical protein